MNGKKSKNRYENKIIMNKRMLMKFKIVKIINKHSVLRRQSRDTNRNIKRSGECQYR